MSLEILCNTRDCRELVGFEGKPIPRISLDYFSPFLCHLVRRIVFKGSPNFLFVGFVEYSQRRAKGRAFALSFLCTLPKQLLRPEMEDSSRQQALLVNPGTGQQGKAGLVIIFMTINSDMRKSLSNVDYLCQAFCIHGLYAVGQIFWLRLRKQTTACIR